MRYGCVKRNYNASDKVLTLMISLPAPQVFLPEVFLISLYSHDARKDIKSVEMIIRQLREQTKISIFIA